MDHAMINLEKIDSGPAYTDGASLDEYVLKQSEIYERNKAAMRGHFAIACRAADANALCDWAPMIADLESKKRMRTLSEVMADSLDFTGGPDLRNVMQLILNVAHGSNLAQAPEQARQLLKDMGAAYAQNNSW